MRPRFEHPTFTLWTMSNAPAMRQDELYAFDTLHLSLRKDRHIRDLENLNGCLRNGKPAEHKRVLGQCRDFYLHLRDGSEFVEDLEGSEFAGLREIKVEAMGAARAMQAERIKLGQHLDDQRIEICDSVGSHLDTVIFRSVLTLDP